VRADIAPPKLAQLVDFAERPRLDDWSLRAALVRYAQPQPQRASDILDNIRRVDFALAKQSRMLEREGPALWDALHRKGDADPYVVGVLGCAQALDDLGEILSAWAVAYPDARPDADVDRVVQRVTKELDKLGVPREERPPGPRNRG
jgi:hypothetical protein